MKKSILIVATCFAVLAAALILSSTGVGACGGGWACGDSVTIKEPAQICVNDRLLTVSPSAVTQLFIHVPGNAAISTDVTNCGGSLLPVPASSVANDNAKHVIQIHALTAPNAPIRFIYGATDETLTSDTGEVSTVLDTN